MRYMSYATLLVMAQVAALELVLRVTAMQLYVVLTTRHTAFGNALFCRTMCMHGEMVCVFALVTAVMLSRGCTDGAMRMALCTHVLVTIGV